MIQPDVVPAHPVPNVSWWEQYGPIGVLAGLLLAALVFIVVRVVLRGWEADKVKTAADFAAKENALAEREKTVRELQAQVVEILQENHKETLRLLDEQRKEYEGRYQELLDASLADARSSRDQIHAVTLKVSRAFESVGKKIRLAEEDET